MTNFDKIKSMTVEKMAEIIMCPYSSKGLICYEGKTCITCSTKWLESEVAE